MEIEILRQATMGFALIGMAYGLYVGYVNRYVIFPFLFSHTKKELGEVN